MKLSLKLVLLLIVLIAIPAFSFALEAATVPSSAEFIVDFSESMNEMIGDKSKIEIAREVVIKILDEISESINTGLTFYGHRDEDKCDNIELLKGLNHQQIKEKLMDTKPSGKAPIAPALRKAVERLEGNNHLLSIILVTDGKGTCEEDILKTAREVKERYDYRVTFHVISLNSKKKERPQLIRIAKAGYGAFANIKNKKNTGRVIKLISDKVKNFKIHNPRIVNLDDIVLIPAGEFLMGKAINDDFHAEPDIHSVYLDAFYIDTYEVTQKQYKTVMGENPSMWIGSDLPVDSVSWFDAKKYCEKVGKRLPTEAEWEKAAKGGRYDKWAGISILKKVGEYAWLDDINVGSRSGSRTHPVGQKKPNGYNIYDMSGNLLEWVADWYNSNYYKISPKNKPKGPDTGVERILRGGSWDNHWLGARTTKKFANPPNVKYNNNGFRCAKSAE